MNTSKTNRIIVRVTDFDYMFLQSLRQEGITISDYMRSALRITPRFLRFIKEVGHA